VIGLERHSVDAKSLRLLFSEMSKIPGLLSNQNIRISSWNDSHENSTTMSLYGYHLA
jgi:hypothetical protein